MGEHKKRAEERAENNPPENFTCGVCGKVHPFVDDKYECLNEEEGE